MVRNTARAIAGHLYEGLITSMPGLRGAEAKGAIDRRVHTTLIHMVDSLRLRFKRTEADNARRPNFMPITRRRARRMCCAASSSGSHRHSGTSWSSPACVRC